jgi:AsmA protein
MKAVRFLLWVLAVIAGLVAVVVVYVAFFFDVNRYKPRIEAAVARATGMVLRIDGPASLKFLPRIRIALNDVHLFNKDSELFAAESLSVTPRLMPYLRHRLLVIDRVSLDHPGVRIEKTPSGRMNYELAQRPGQAASQGSGRSSAQRAGAIHGLDIDDGDLLYLDAKTGRRIQVTHLNATLSSISWGPGDPARTLSLKGDLSAMFVKSGELLASDLKCRLQDHHGLVHITGLEAKAFGGAIRGNAEADLRGGVPKLKLAETATHVDLGQIPSALKGRVAGFVDGSVDLSASGNDAQSLTRTAVGMVSAQGKDVTLNGIDLDALAGQLKSPQGLDLARLGSSLLAGMTGPPGQAAGIASQAAGKKTLLRGLAFDWKIDHGIAHAQDVALATAHSIVAFRGNIDLRNRQYQGFAMASVDAQGCSKQKLGIVGSLTRPRPSAASVGEQVERSLLGRAGGGGSAGSQIAGILGQVQRQGQGQAPGTAPPAAGGCDHFYAGSALRGR